MTVKEGKAILRFKTSTGLSPIGKNLEGFEVAGADKVFHKAKAYVNAWEKTMEISCDEVEEPVAVRYAFKNYAAATLFNDYDIPVSSFRTDNWE